MPTRIARPAEPITVAALASLSTVTPHWVDAMAVPLPPDTSATDFCRDVMLATPRWVRGLLTMRDVLVRPFGLHTQARGNDVRFEPGARMGPFVVYSADADEVLLGDDDAHVRFRTSFAVRDSPTGREGVCTTVVVCSNVFGTAYFRVIRPFHVLIVRGVIERVVDSPQR